MPRKKRNTSENHYSSEAGQSGDLQGLSEEPEAESESVRELAAEGQSYEAAVVAGVESAPDADRGEVRTKQIPEDDVPSEYVDRSPDERGE